MQNKPPHKHDVGKERETTTATQMHERKKGMRSASQNIYVRHMLQPKNAQRNGLKLSKWNEINFSASRTERI